jgi:Holliday junction resolvase RusA-like endonuclease
MINKITITVDRPKGKKNNGQIVRGRNGKPTFRTNPEAKRDEANIAMALIAEATRAGWDIPISSYVELDIDYDALIDKITITVTKLEATPPKTKWGGKYDIQNIIDTVADALEVRKAHPGIITNDNRVARVESTRRPLIKHATNKRRSNRACEPPREKD